MRYIRLTMVLILYTVFIRILATATIINDSRGQEAQ